VRIRRLTLLLLSFALSKTNPSAAPPYQPLPAWRPAPAASDRPIVRKSDPRPVTHRISSREVTIGFSDKGGGYLNFCDRGDGLNIVSPLYGRGWQHSIRDAMHSGRYNPTQAGFRDHYGVPVRCRVDGGRFIIEKFNMPLYGDPVFDFTEYEDLAEDAPVYKDSDNSDTDALDETGKTQDDELRSEFDFAGTYEDVSDLTGNGISAFRHRFHYAYVREPAAMLQFGKEATLLSGEPVLQANRRVVDASPEALPGDQTPTDTDLSLVQSTLYSIRLLKTPDLDVRAALWRQDGQWRVLERQESGGAIVPRMDDRLIDLRTTAGQSTRRAHPPKFADFRAEGNLFVFTSDTDPAAGRAIGLFVPDSPQNTRQVVGLHRDTGEPLYAEDRRLNGWFQMGWARGPHIILVARTTLTGLLAPGRGRPDAVEAIYGEVFILFGTPEEILRAARNIEE
jgi:hypothetical protein